MSVTVIARGVIVSGASVLAKSFESEVDMPHYEKLPSQERWLKDMRQTGLRSLTATKYDQVARIGDMLAELRGMDRRVVTQRIELLAHILIQLAFLIKYRNRADKLGKGKLSDHQARSAAALRTCVEKLPSQLLDARDAAALNQQLNEFLSKTVGLHEKLADDDLLTRNAIDWLTAVQVKALKLSFRGGLAYP